MLRLPASAAGRQSELKPMTDVTAGNGHASTGGLEPPVTKARASEDPTAASRAKRYRDARRAFLRIMPPTPTQSPLRPAASVPFATLKQGRKIGWSKGTLRHRQHDRRLLGSGPCPITNLGGQLRDPGSQHRNAFKGSSREPRPVTRLTDWDARDDDADNSPNRSWERERARRTARRRRCDRRTRRR
jgi:hypothetical protein